MAEDNDSYEEYKRYLEESLGISAVKAPMKPMNAFMRFFLERGCQERQKGDASWGELTKKLSEEWRGLSDKKKQIYEQSYELQMNKRADLMTMYNQLAKNKKASSPYFRFYKKRYAAYTKQLKNATASQISRLISEDWKKLSERERAKLAEEYEKQKVDLELNAKSDDFLKEYERKCEQYNDQLRTEKQKLYKKYGFNKDARKNERRKARRQEQMKKRAMKQLERAQKKKALQLQRQKQREEKLKQLQEAKEKVRLEKEAKKREEEKKRKEQQRAKSEAKVKQEKPSAKKEDKKEDAKKGKSQSVSKSKSKPKTSKKAPSKSKSKPKAPPKTKKIAKKAPVKKVVKKAKKDEVKEEIVKAETKKAVKKSVKAKPKAAKAKPSAKAKKSKR